MKQSFTAAPSSTGAGLFDGPEIDLLAMFDVSKHTSLGGAAAGDGELRFTHPEGACQVYFPNYSPPLEYDLEIVATPTSGPGTLVIGLVAGGRQCRVVVDTERKNELLSGLAPIGGLWVDEEGYRGAHRGRLLTQGKASTVVCQVRKNGITAMCDGRTFIDFHEPWERLGQLHYYVIPVNALSVASWKSKFILTRLVVHTPTGDVVNNDSPATPNTAADTSNTRVNTAAPSANQASNSQPNEPGDVPAASSTNSSPKPPLERSITDIVEQCEQAVVKIVVEGSEEAGLGSGFVVDSTGTLVTNVHVLAGAHRATATFPNGTTCEIRGTRLIDEARDICIAQLDGRDFPVLKIAAALPRKGERVIALGSPRGLSFSATTGVVSAIRPAEELAREIGRPDMKGTWIQVDAALSAGNSGGPLINDRGEVVGMSTLASQGSAQNLNFGVSGADILKLRESSGNQALVTLPDGVGKLESSRASSGTLGNRPAVPQDKLKAYVRDSQSQFRDLLRGVKQELVRKNETLKEMKKGQNYLPPNAEDAEVLRVIDERTKKSTYYFRSQIVKDREISRMQTRVRELQAIIKSATDSSSNDSMYALLSKYGPHLDPRRLASVGFMFDAVVVNVFDEHGVIVLYDDMLFLLWVESAAGLHPGSELMPLNVYVAGTKTVEIPGESSRVVTLLYAVSDAELRDAIFDGDTGSDE